LYIPFGIKKCYAMLILVQARFKTNRHTNYLVELIVQVEFKLVRYKFTLYFMSSSQSPPSLLMLPPIVCVIMDMALTLQCLCQHRCINGYSETDLRIILRGEGGWYLGVVESTRHAFKIGT